MLFSVGVGYRYLRGDLEVLGIFWLFGRCRGLSFMFGGVWGTRKLHRRTCTVQWALKLLKPP